MSTYGIARKLRNKQDRRSKNARMAEALLSYAARPKRRTPALPDSAALPSIAAAAEADAYLKTARVYADNLCRRGIINHRLVLMLVFCIPLAMLSACVSALQESASGASQDVQTSSRNDAGGPPAVASSGGKATDMDRLARLWRERQEEKLQTEYPIGPGDVIEISVPAIEELRGRTVRVSGDGTISLPFVGKLEAAGLTEEQLQNAIAQALLKYMYSPRVVTFVREYHSRQVAVLGAVTKPGLYSLSTGSDTILDVISQAGGMAAAADPKMYLIPAQPAEGGRAKEIASSLPDGLLGKESAPLVLKGTDPILIDVKRLADGGNQIYLSLSVRPGDVIIVPGGGQVLVEGWVEKPGAYNVTPGLTVAGVVAATGGALFPADVNAVKVLRADKEGTKSTTLVDLEKIKRGESPDVSLQSGDIVEVASQTSKLIPYGLYKFVTAIVNMSVNGSVPIK